MAENPSNFVRDWISENVQGCSSSESDIDARVAQTMERLRSASREAEIPQDDPELAPDLLRDLIRAAIESQSPAAPGASQ